MLLENKMAVIYGAGGSIGGAVARGFAREGARLFLAGRTQVKLDQVSHDVRSHGGAAGAAVAETAVVDALDERGVDEFVDRVAAQAGRIDISFNLISYGDVQEPLMEISTEDFLQPITMAMRSQFLTTRAAARHMIRQKSGVILFFGGGGVQTLPGLGGFKVALDALESLRRQWACELGQYGVRLVTLKTGGIPESISEGFEFREVITESIVKETLLKRAATFEDVGNVAAFVASDMARSLTGTDVNISCGAMLD